MAKLNESIGLKRKQYFYKLIFIIFLSYVQSALSYNINPKKITVSGISAGGYFAQQFHIAFSKQISGAGLIATGPYYCSQGQLLKALFSCMSATGGGGAGVGKVDLAPLTSYINTAKEENKIDDPVNLGLSKIYILTGKSDDVVPTSIVESLHEQYIQLGILESNMLFEKNISRLGHAFPTLSYGNNCDEPRKGPFISRCDFSGAQKILTQMYGPLKPALPVNESSLKSFAQTKFLKNATDYSIAEKGYVYVPKSCENGEECALHVSFHGCLQNTEKIGLDYVTKIELNEYAEANNIIILYPQAAPSTALSNPNACWDWWGYTGSEFANKQGVQMEFVNNMIQFFKNPKNKIEQ